MHVFVTGGAGLIGKALIADLLREKHTISALARSDGSAEYLNSVGVKVLRGSLDDLDVLKQGASSADGVAHLAFTHDFEGNFAHHCDIDRAAIKAMASSLEGTNKPIIIASATGFLSKGRFVTENDPPDMENPVISSVLPRAESEILAKELAKSGINISVIRIPPVNHGEKDHSFLRMMVNTAREKKASVYVDSGENRWAATHYLDTAVVFRLALETAKPGAVYHAMAEEEVKMKDIAEAIGQSLGVPVLPKSVGEAKEHMGFLGLLVGVDNPMSSKKTKEVLGWKPAQCTLLEDIKQGAYN